MPVGKRWQYCTDQKLDPTTFEQCMQGNLIIKNNITVGKLPSVLNNSSKSVKKNNSIIPTQQILSINPIKPSLDVLNESPSELRSSNIMPVIKDNSVSTLPNISDTVNTPEKLNKVTDAAKYIKVRLDAAATYSSMIRETSDLESLQTIITQIGSLSGTVNRAAEAAVNAAQEIPNNLEANKIAIQAVIDANKITNYIETTTIKVFSKLNQPLYDEIDKYSCITSNKISEGRQHFCKTHADIARNALNNFLQSPNMQELKKSGILADYNDILTAFKEGHILTNSKTYSKYNKYITFYGGNREITDSEFYHNTVYITLPRLESLYKSQHEGSTKKYNPNAKRYGQY
jgi:hypothetical protein